MTEQDKILLDETTAAIVDRMVAVAGMAKTLLSVMVDLRKFVDTLPRPEPLGENPSQNETIEALRRELEAARADRDRAEAILASMQPPRGKGMTDTVRKVVEPRKRARK